MNRIDKTFHQLKKDGRKGLIGYMTAGDPKIDQSEANIREAIDAGIDLLELGMPFSDPTADGPTIQAASQRALQAGMNMDGVLHIVSNLRADYAELPIILFGYANPLFVCGYEKVCNAASKAGVDGMLVVDLPLEESGELRPHLDAAGMCFIPLIAPTTSISRAKDILKQAQGFVYYIMVTGVTGARASLASGVEQHVEELRGLTKLPIAVGFGISNGKQARQACGAADAVVVGSALVRAAAEGNLKMLVRDLSAALR